MRRIIQSSLVRSLFQFRDLFVVPAGDQIGLELLIGAVRPDLGDFSVEGGEDLLGVGAV